MKNPESIVHVHGSSLSVQPRLVCERFQFDLATRGPRLFSFALRRLLAILPLLLQLPVVLRASITGISGKRGRLALRPKSTPLWMVD
jgi:hypothetical protein